jgi:H+-transporting ATPase
MTQPTIPTAGLTCAEAAARLAQYGPNALPETKPHPFLEFLKLLWGPIPWLLEITVILQLLLGKVAEAIIIALLILFNAVFSTIQAKRSSDALALLRQQLKLTARVHRDGAWTVLPSDQLVPGDIIHIRMGDLLPADVKIFDGDLLLDQSVLTGEALPVEVSGGGDGYAGAIVKHGEATAIVTATGVRTRFGRTAELVRQAQGKSNLEEVIFSITKSLVILAALLAIGIIAYAVIQQMPLLEIMPFALILLVASVPAALPATFAIATALGAQELSHQGVLVTNLTAIEDAAGMDVLCSDKTGTITQNQLSVAQLHPDQAQTEEALLRLAAMACDPSTQDPIDLAILKCATERKVLPDFSLRTQFIPFDPETKRSEAYFSENNALIHVLKGAPHAIAAICQDAPATLEAEVNALAAQGYRVLGVAHGVGQRVQLSGLVSLQDPPRPDSAEMISRLRNWGIRVLMITGDGLSTAQAVARQVGLGARACTAQALTAPNANLSDCDVFAEVLPEHKYDIVQTLQKQGHIVGMTGDGVNDAPALHQAQVGIAVANATDVAKAAASLVLTTPGLEHWSEIKAFLSLSNSRLR